jgi:hypothetical protein
MFKPLDFLTFGFAFITQVAVNLTTILPQLRQPDFNVVNNEKTN